MKKSVIFHFLLADWDIDPRKPFLKEIMKATSQWCEPVLIQQPVCLFVHSITKFRRKIVGLFLGRYKTRRIPEGGMIFTPIILFNYSLWLKNKFFAFFDIILFTIQFKQFVNKYYPNRFIILWFFSNVLYPLIRKIKNDFVVYDYQDNYDYESDGKWSDINAQFNELLIRRSDLVVCTAKVMFNRANTLNRNSVYIPNGNNFEMLSRKANAAPQDQIFEVDRKIVGFLGNIRNWMDFALINKLVVKLKDVQFLFIGYLNRESKRDVHYLMKYQNFMWIPYVEQEKVGVYIQRFDVGIIPFKINKYMDGVFPNKFFEYMAAEVPIVTTALAELREYSGIIGYSNTHEEFISNCIDALDGKFDERVKTVYGKLAKANSWVLKAEKINKILFEVVNTKLVT